MGAAPIGSLAAAGSEGLRVSASKYDIFSSLNGENSSATELSSRSGKDCEKMLVVPWLQVVAGKSDGEGHFNTGNKRRYSRRERENQHDDQCVPCPAPQRRKLDESELGRKRLLESTPRSSVFAATSHNCPIQRLLGDKYQLRDCLGEGTYSKVYEAIEIDISKQYAIKIISKNHRKLQGSGRLYDKEINILQSLKPHLCIVKLHDVLRSPTHVCMVLDLAEGGDLASRLTRDGCFSEERSKCIVRMILEGVLHLHQNGVTHRDLKLENILFKTEALNSDIVISDFGLAYQKKGQSENCDCNRNNNSTCKGCKSFFSMKGEDGMSTTCGTPEYLSPEMLDGDIYSNKVDLWAVGVIAYALISGNMPFANEDGSGRGRARMYQRIKEAKYTSVVEVSDVCRLGLVVVPTGTKGADLIVSDICYPTGCHEVYDPQSSNCHQRKYENIPSS